MVKFRFVGETGFDGNRCPKEHGTGEGRQHTRIERVAPRNKREAEFEKLYLESYGLVFGYVRSRVTCDADAEDIVAEAYLNAARSFSSFDPSRAKFSTWVVTIARNCMISHFRKERPVSSLDDAPQEAYAIEGGQKNVDDHDTAIRLLACLDDLSCQIVLLKYMDGMKNVDIARELQMKPSTVATKLANALAKMRGLAERSE